MARIIFTGGSDDLIDIDGKIAGCDEYDTCAGNVGKGYAVQAVFRVSDAPSGESCDVVAVYGGTWGFAVCPDESRHDEPGLPSWPVSVVPHNDPTYSSSLVMDVPDTATIAKVDVYDRIAR